MPSGDPSRGRPAGAGVGAPIVPVASGTFGPASPGSERFAIVEASAELGPAGKVLAEPAALGADPADGLVAAATGDTPALGAVESAASGRRARVGALVAAGCGCAPCAEGAELAAVPAAAGTAATADGKALIVPAGLDGFIPAVSGSDLFAVGESSDNVDEPLLGGAEPCDDPAAVTTGGALVDADAEDADAEGAPLAERPPWPPGDPADDETGALAVPGPTVALEPAASDSTRVAAEPVGCDPAGEGCEVGNGGAPVVPAGFEVTASRSELFAVVGATVAVGRAGVPLADPTGWATADDAAAPVVPAVVVGLALATSDSTRFAAELAGSGGDPAAVAGDGGAPDVPAGLNGFEPAVPGSDLVAVVEAPFEGDPVGAPVVDPAG